MSRLGPCHLLESSRSQCMSGLTRRTAVTSMNLCAVQTQIQRIRVLKINMFPQLQIFCRWRYWVLNCGFGAKCSLHRDSKGARFFEILLMTEIILIIMNICSSTNYHIVTHSHDTAIISFSSVNFYKHLLIL